MSEKLVRFAARLPGELDEMAHHVFPQKFEEFFKELGINIHDPRLGAWWESKDHLKNAAKYNKEWEKYLGEAKRIGDEVLQRGRDLAREYGIKINF